MHSLHTPDIADEVVQFVAGALSLPASHEDVKRCVSVLRYELVRDVATLKECWDVVKDKMPALPRLRIDALLVRPYQVDTVTPISPTIWLKNGVICLLFFAGPCVLGLLTWDQTSSAGTYDASLGYTVWLPLVALSVIEIAVASKMAPNIGWHMICEASEGADLREALKNSMTTQGFIAALFVTVVWAMLQADPIQDDTGLIISQWYTGLLVISIAQTLVGTMASVTCLLFLEPLTGDAALDCVYNNFMYFGEPMALSAFGFVNSMFATILWVFGTYGWGLGAFYVLLFFYGALRSLVIYDYISSWKNPEVDLVVRETRQGIHDMVATTGRRSSVPKSPSIKRAPPPAHVGNI